MCHETVGGSAVSGRFASVTYATLGGREPLEHTIAAGEGENLEHTRAYRLPGHRDP
jgi:hypothetical protein